MNMMQIAALFAGADVETVSLFTQFMQQASKAPDRNAYLKKALKKALEVDVKVIDVKPNPIR